MIKGNLGGDGRDGQVNCCNSGGGSGEPDGWNEIGIAFLTKVLHLVLNRGEQQEGGKSPSCGGFSPLPLLYSAGSSSIQGFFAYVCFIFGCKAVKLSTPSQSHQSLDLVSFSSSDVARSNEVQFISL